MWKLLFSFLSGSLGGITDDITRAYEAKLKATNDSERLALDERINILEARKSIVLAAQSDPWERFVRILFALGPIIYLNKLFIYDKVLGLGSTDGLSADLTQVMWVIIGGYFIDATVRGTAKILKK